MLNTSNVISIIIARSPLIIADVEKKEMKKAYEWSTLKAIENDVLDSEKTIVAVFASIRRGILS